MKKRKIYFYKNRFFYIILAICLLFVGCLFKFEYATDTYSEAMNLMDSANWLLSNGRPFTALMFYSFGSANAPIEAVYYFSYILSLVCLVITVYQIYLMLKGKISNEWVRAFISSLIIINPLVIDYFLFLEKGIFILGIMIGVFSARCFIRAMKGEKIFYFISLLLEMIVGFIYQPLLALFGVISVFSIADSFRDFKNFFYQTIIAALIFIIGALPDFLFLKLYPDAQRISSSFDISKIWKVLTIAGPWLSVLTYVFVFGMFFLFSYIKFRSKDNKKPYWFHLLMHFYIYIGSLIIVIVPLGFAPTAGIAFRIIYPLFVMGVLMVAALLFDKNKKINKSNNHNKQKNIFLIAFLSLEFIFFQGIFISRFINNHMDEQEIHLIQREIENYENKFTFKIHNISFYRDGDSHNVHLGTLSLGLNFKSFMTDWSDINSVNYLLKKNYKKIDNDSTIYNQHFKNYKSDYFDANKQLVFVEDTLHIYVY